MKAIINLLLLALTLGAAQNGNAQTTTLYETTFPNANSVNAASGWVLTNGTAWVSANGGVSGGGSLNLGPSTSATATMPVLQAGFANLSIEITAIWGSFIYYQTSPDGSTWTPASNTSSPSNIFNGSSTATTTKKNLPDGTRYIKLTARDATGDMYIQAIKITGVDPCDHVITGVTLNKSTSIVGTNSTETLVATMQPSCNPTNVTWSSSNTAVATVSSGGVVSGIAPGTATITATTVSGGFTAQCVVTVKTIAATGITLNKTQTSIRAGATEPLTASVLPAQASNKAVTWESNNTAVATVNSDGLVSGIAPGTATITARSDDGGFTASCVVTVTASNLDANFTGKGTQGNPYLIGTATELDSLAALVNSGESTAGKYFLLTQNINLNSTAWTAIGNAAGKEFKGFFNGDGYEISGLNSTMGLFGYTDGAAIYNVTISGASRTGGLVAYAKNTTIAYCTNRTSVSSNSAGVTAAVGGIAGYLQGNSRILYSTNRGAITHNTTGSGSGAPDASFFTGGIVGSTENTDSILYCVNMGTVTSRITYTTNYATGSIRSGHAYAYAAGIAGNGFNISYCSNLTAVNCSTAVDVSAYTGSGGSICYSRAEAAGIAILGTDGRIYNSYNRGIIIANATGENENPTNNPDWGYNNADSRASGVGSPAYSSYNTGNVAATSSRSQSTNQGPKTTTGSSATYATVGASATSSYYLSTITLTGTKVGSASSLTAAQLQNIPSAWTASDIWAKDAAPLQNNGYPVMKKKGVAFCHGGINTFEFHTGDYGAVISAPEASSVVPYQPGYSEFDTWCTTPSRTTAWNFAADVLKSDTTRLYAKFLPTKHTVYFNSNGGSSVDSQIVRYTMLADKPENPVRDNFTFQAWYKDEALTIPWNFETDVMPDEDITLYANWQVTITFNPGKGAVSPATQLYVENSAYGETFPTPTRAGYTFDGWATDSTLRMLVKPTDIATVSTTFYARWEVTIKFNTDGGDPLAPKNYVGGLEFDFESNEGLPTPVREGYIFGSWYADLILENQRLNTDQVPLKRQDTMYAKWGETVTVTFEPNNGEPAQSKEFVPLRRYNAVITWEGTTFNNGFVANPTNPDALFAGWYDAGLTELIVVNDTVPNYPHTLYAKWLYKHTVAFETNGGSTIAPKDYFPNYAYNASSATDGVNTGLPEDPTRENSVFLGWYEMPDFSGTRIFAGDIVNANITILYAKWSTKNTINFQTYGGTEIPAREYFFDYAYYANLPDGLGTNPGLPSNPSKTDAIFIGWYDSPEFDGAQITNSSMVNANVTTLYANWSTRNTINFETYGGTTSFTSKDYYFGFAFSASSATNGFNTGLPSNPTKTDAIFTGWYDNHDFEGVKMENTTIISSDITTLYANYSEKISITFEPNGGTMSSTTKDYYADFAFSASSLTNGVNTGLPSNPAKANALFMGWYDNIECSGTALTPTSLVSRDNPVIYAKWSEKVTVTFEPNGGTMSSTTKDYYAEYAYSASSFTSGVNNGFPSNPTKTDAYFVGWYEKSDFSGVKVSLTDLVKPYASTLYAKWSMPINVQFESNGGTVIADRKYYPDYAFANTTPSNPGLPTPAPTKDSAFFVGWYAAPDFSGEQITNYATFTGDITVLYARWAEKTWVTFIDYEEDTVQRKAFYHSLTYYNISPNTGLPNAIPASRPGFLGWYSTIVGKDSKVSDDSLVPNSNATLHARWCVEVSFETNGGDAIAKRIYTPNTRYNQLPNEGLPTVWRNRYSFEGWYANAGLTQPITAESIVYDGAHTLYAKWKEAPAIPAKFTVTITQSAGGAISVKNGSFNVSSGTVLDSATVLTLQASPNAGYKLVKWFDNDTNASRTVALKSNLTISATFEALPDAPVIPKYTITLVQPNNGTFTVKNNGELVSSGDKIDSATVLTLQAAPNAGYKFVKWHDNNTNASRTITLKSNLTISATFEALPDAPTIPKYTVTITQSAGGAISVKNGSFNVSSGTQVDSATVLTLQASPNTGYKFVKWHDNNTDANRTVTLKSNITISATFEALPTIPQYTVTLVQPNNGTFTVKNNGELVSSGDKIDSATVLTLQAAPNAGYKFVKWHDNNTDANRTITLKSNLTISATFEETASAIVDKETEEGLKIYPNPVNYELVITNYEWKQGDLVELFDMTGKRVYSIKPTLSIVNGEALNGVNYQLSINMSSFKTGTYILRISDASGVVSGVARVVKQ